MGIAAQHFTTKTKISELLNLENKKKNRHKSHFNSISALMAMFHSDSFLRPLFCGKLLSG